MDGGRLRQRYGVVPTEHDGHDPGLVHGPEALRYPPVARLNVARYHRHVAVVDRREELEDRDALGGVVGPEEVRDAPYTLGAEAGTDAEGCARVERGADHRRVGVLEVTRVRQAGEGAHPGETRALEGVGGLVPNNHRASSHAASPRSLIRTFDHYAHSPEFVAVNRDF